MRYTTQPGGTYGGFIGNQGLQNAIAGVDLPFGGGGGYKTIQEQYRPGSTDRQRIPDPIRIFPQNEPGREGAINVQFRQALGFPGMQPMGNAGAFMNNSQFYMGPQFGQMPTGFQNKTVS